MSGPDPVWEEEFVLDDIPEDVVMFTITVYNAGKRSKDSEVAEVTIELSNLRNGEESEEWHPLTGITPVGEWGAVRLRYRYFHDLMMGKYHKFWHCCDIALFSYRCGLYY